VIKKIYIDVNGVQLHARVAGIGPPVMVLHASPLSSAFMQGHIEHLARDFSVLAVDTPGYGASDPLPAAPTSLADYGKHLLSAASNYGWEKFALYGTATGAQIALATAKLAPARVVKLVLDNCAHFEKELRDAWIQDYFPDLSALGDGSHWRKAWDIAAAQFQYFPWHIQSAVTALNRASPPADMITQMAMGFLAAKPSYAEAYQLAFQAEDVKSFEQLTVPTILIDWRGSIVRRYVLALIDKGLPAIVSVVTCGERPQDRLLAIARALL
jgi:pimeloyl-ACP methyl ester carboxylesterase